MRTHIHDIGPPIIPYSVVLVFVGEASVLWLETFLYVVFMTFLHHGNSYVTMGYDHVTADNAAGRNEDGQP